MRGFRWLGWPIRKVGQQFGRGATEGVLAEVKDQAASYGPPTFDHPPPEGASAMPSFLGVNKNTNAAGWALIIWQIVQIVVPILIPGGHAIQVAPETNVAVTGAITGMGLLSAKDKTVVGAGTTGPDAARKVA